MLKKLKGIRFQMMRTELYIIYFSLLIISLISFLLIQYFSLNGCT
ncbi:hypothetical protein [Piscibacillus salipiscarius]|nr:hypothetical protein [Piscibacillus salipiscarius]